MVVCQVLLVGRLDFPKIALGRQKILKRRFIRFVICLVCRDILPGVGNEAVLVEGSMVMKCLNFLKLVAELSSYFTLRGFQGVLGSCHPVESFLLTSAVFLFVEPWQTD